MREIKFRAWDKQTKTMSPPRTLEELCMMQDGISCLAIAEGDIIWLQHTGLTDCKGREIYEGDVVSMPYNRCMQSWQVLEMSAYGQRFLRLTGKPRPTPHYFRELHHFDECEVIGNIYEHPELVK